MDGYSNSSYSLYYLDLGEVGEKDLSVSLLS